MLVKRAVRHGETRSAIVSEKPPMLISAPRADWLDRIPVRCRLQFAAGSSIEVDCRKVWVVLEGHVRVCLLSRDGRERLLWYLPPYSTFGEMTVLRGAVQGNIVAIADTPCCIGQIPAEDFREALCANPDFVLDIMTVATSKMMMLLHELEDAAFGSARVQIARILSTLTQKTASVVISQERLASITGKTRATVAAQLHYLEDLGAIRLKRSGIMIIAPELLAQVAQSSGDPAGISHS